MVSLLSVNSEEMCLLLPTDAVHRKSIVEDEQELRNLFIAI